MQAVAAVMNQLCVRFPMIAAHNATSAFAVACPEARLPDTRAALTALQAPLSIFNMSTGAKTHVLVFSRAQAGGRAGSGSGASNPLLPILKVRVRLLCEFESASDLRSPNARCMRVQHVPCTLPLVRVACFRSVLRNAFRVSSYFGAVT